MNKILLSLYGLVILSLFSCAINRSAYHPDKKFSQAVLQKEYILLRTILEKKHPSLYWYTPKDSMDIYFGQSYAKIKDSMTEQQFVWKIIAPLIHQIHCGHTSVSMSKAYSKWANRRELPSFPYFLKVWNDTMAVTGQLNKNDSIFKRGTVINSINGKNAQSLLPVLFNYMSQDGYEENNNFIRISSNFPYYHRNVFGLSKVYQIEYKDSLGKVYSVALPAYFPPKDSTKKNKFTPEVVKIPKQNRMNEYRSFEIDSTKKFAVMKVNTFSAGRLRSFFRKSFKTLRKNNIPHLVLDMRINGGGKVNASTLLTKYISRKPFKVSDSLYAVTKNLGRYTKYIKGNFLNNIELLFICKKRKDGYFHLTNYENKLYLPKKRNHYSGKVYVLINGPTFSAACLFANAVKGQSGITLLGENTGGGWYGNNGIMIPEIILPSTGVRVRLPLFRLIQFQHQQIKGTGIVPDVYIGTDYQALKMGYDKKLRWIKEQLIRGAEIKL